MPKQNRKKDGRKDLIYYSHLLINKTKRAGLILLVSSVFILLVITISENILSQRSWDYLLVPVFLLGLPLIFFPSVEKWVYRPWQAKPQKYERHYRD